MSALWTNVHQRGLNKFFNYIPVPEDVPEKSMKMFTVMIEITWLPEFQALGAAILTPIMAGILPHHFTLGDDPDFTAYYGGYSGVGNCGEPPKVSADDSKHLTD